MNQSEKMQVETNSCGSVVGVSAETLALLCAIPGPVATWVTFDHMNNARVAYRVKDGETGQSLYGVVQLPVPFTLIEKNGLRATIKELATVVAEQLAAVSSKAPLTAAADSIGKVVSEVKKESGNVVSFPASQAPAEAVPKAAEPQPAAAAPAPARGRRRAAPAAPKEEIAPAAPATLPPAPEPAEDQEPTTEEPSTDEPAGGDEFGVDPGDVVCVFGKHKGKTLRQIMSENIDSIRWYAATMPQAVPVKEKRPLTDEEKMMVEASRQLLNQREASR